MAHTIETESRGDRPTLDEPRLEWLSAHVNIDSASIYDAEADRVICDAIEPAANHLIGTRLASSYFFVRYSEGRPHIRVRIKTACAEPWRVRREFESFCVATTARLSGPDGSPASGADGVSTNRVEWVPYEPEVERYGGSAALEVAHSVFSNTSRLAARLVTASPRRQNRLASALVTMVVTLHAFQLTKLNAAAVVTHLHEGYMAGFSARHERVRVILTEQFKEGLRKQFHSASHLIETTWSVLDENRSLYEDLDVLHRTLRSSCQNLRELEANGRVTRGGYSLNWNECIRTILPSYVHMTNNRLGLSTVDEAYTCFIAGTVLGRESILDG